MGGADIVPGVSGGTVALVVGIYERLISSIRAAAASPVALARGGPAAARERLREVEWGLVLPLAAGILLAIAVGAVVILPLRDAFPEGTRAVFLGLVGASIVVPWRRIRQRGPATVAVLLATAVVAFVLVGLPPREVTDPGLLRVAGSAAVAICAMILPGVSGAFLLEVFGIYNLTLEALRSLDLAYVATFGAGAVVGLGLFARLLETLLARWHDLTMAALTGLMVGALRALWPWLAEDRGLLVPPSDASAITPILLTVAAFVGLRLLLRLGAGRAETAA
jgi:putative membrane protein